jgi:type IV pilus assembly protein PilN
MTRINLLEVKVGVQSVEHRRQLRLGYVLIGANVAAVLLASLVLRGLAARQAATMGTTKKRITELTKVVHDVEGEERQQQMLEEKRRVIGDLERRGIGPFRILEALSDATPSRLWLTEFTDRSGEVTITGLAIDDPTVADFLARLQRSPHFHGLELVETAQAEEGKMRVKKFVMKGPLNYSGNGHPGNGTPPAPGRAVPPGTTAAPKDGSSR